MNSKRSPWLKVVLALCLSLALCPLAAFGSEEAAVPADEQLPVADETGSEETDIDAVPPLDAPCGLPVGESDDDVVLPKSIGFFLLERAADPGVNASASEPVAAIAPRASGNCTGDHTGWKVLPAAGGTLEAGTYYLDGDVQLADNLVIPGGTDVTLCLNGHTLTAAAGKDAQTVVVKTRAAFTLSDCQGAGVITGASSLGQSKDGTCVLVGQFSDDTAAFTMYGGSIQGGKGGINADGGGVSVQGRSTFDLYGGYIENNQLSNVIPGAHGGGGVEAEGDATFTMHGGTIRNNVSTSTSGGGGGVSIGGTATFVMKGGSITGNTTDGSGGGIFLSSSVPAVIEGGDISNNKASLDGGGVYCLTDVSLVLRGGSIADNEAQAYGGGVYAGGTTVELAGGSITGNKAASATYNPTAGYGGGVYLFKPSTPFTPTRLIVSGPAKVSGNTIGSSAATENVKIPTGETIAVTGDLAGASIGVTHGDGTGAFTSGYGSNGNNQSKVSAFTSDNAANVVVSTSGEAKLIAAGDACTVTFDVDGRGTAPESALIQKGTPVPEPTAPTATDYEFGGWYEEAGCTNKWSFTNAVPGDKTLHAKWTSTAPATHTVTFNANGHGTAPSPATVSHNAPVNKPDDLTAEGYIFGGWYTDVDCQYPYEFSTPVVEDLMLYAKWTLAPKPKFTVTFHADGGTPEPPVQTLEAGQSVVEPQVTKPDFAFGAWFFDAACTKDTRWDFATSVMPANDLDLYATWGIAVDTTNFPDTNFRTKVVAPFDVNEDGVLSNSELAAVTVIKASSYKISSLDGIRHFKELKNLECASNSLTALDVSQNTKLTHLNCLGNKITSLDVSSLKGLTELKCMMNKLDALDVSANTKLEYLSVSRNQNLGTLDVSKNTVLTYLACDAIGLAELDVSKNVLLNTLECYGNALTKLDVSKNINLTTLRIKNNKIAFPDLTLPTTLPATVSGVNQTGSTVVAMQLSSDRSHYESVDTYASVLAGLSFAASGPVSYDAASGKFVTVDALATLGKQTVDTAQVVAGLTTGSSTAGQHFPLAGGTIEFVGPGTHAVTFVPNGGAPAPAQQTHAVGELVVAPAAMSNASDPELSFGAWFSSADCSQGTKWDFDADVMPDDDLTLYASWGIALDEAHFPDGAFRVACASFDVNGDGVLSQAEREAVVEINVSGKGIKDLSGIEYFPNLKKLDCSGNDLESLDVSNNPKLEDLDCSDNNLDSLDVSKNDQLKDLQVGGNGLSFEDLVLPPDGVPDFSGMDGEQNSRLEIPMALTADRSHYESVKSYSAMIASVAFDPEGEVSYNPQTGRFVTLSSNATLGEQFIKTAKVVLGLTQQAIEAGRAYDLKGGTIVFIEQSDPTPPPTPPTPPTPTPETVEIGLEPVSIYTGGTESNFPNPVFTNLDEKSRITVNGKLWDVAEKGYPFSVAYTKATVDENGKVSDAGTLVADDAEPGLYIAHVVPAGVASQATDTVTVDGKNVTYGTGVLTVRSVADPSMADNQLGTVVNPVRFSAPMVLATDMATAVIDASSVCSINGDASLGTVPLSHVGLLFDDVLAPENGSASREALLKEKAAPTVAAAGLDPNKATYQIKYLDLVDYLHGNAWVSSSKGATVYWPYPQGMDETSKFSVVHFKGLNREYGINGNPDVERAIALCNPEAVDAEATASGIRFTVPASGFSPYAVVFEAEAADEPAPDEPVRPSDPVDPGSSDPVKITTAAGTTSKSGDGVVIAVVGLAALVLASAGALLIAKRRRSLDGMRDEHA